jgi:prepilin signal peptidase PulO-like enzyme (type II secretory pathway)
MQTSIGRALPFYVNMVIFSHRKPTFGGTILYQLLFRGTQRKVQNVLLLLLLVVVTAVVVMIVLLVVASVFLIVVIVGCTTVRPFFSSFLQLIRN